MLNFIERLLIKRSRIKTRFCPEPSGFLHLGHVKNFIINYKLSFCLNGSFSVRLDNSNPLNSKYFYSKQVYYDLLKLGFKKKIKFSYSSDYFGRLYLITKKFIKCFLFYVDNLQKSHFTFFSSIFKFRSTFENLYLLKKMRLGLYLVSEFTVRALIDSKSNFYCMRDPIVYRIVNSPSFSFFCNSYIYPLYDFCHSISDRIEKITHSICTSEFLNNNVLYNWFINCYNKVFNKYMLCKQIEFSRLEINGVILSKRKINFMIRSRIYKNWNDPRLFTVNGLLNRGFSSNCIKNVAYQTGYTKSLSVINYLNIKRIFIKFLSLEVTKSIVLILKPLKLIIINLFNLKEIYVENRLLNIKCSYIIYFNFKISLFFLKLLKNGFIVCFFSSNIFRKGIIDPYIIKGKQIPTFLTTYNFNGICVSKCISFSSFEINLNKIRVKAMNFGYFVIYLLGSFFIAKEIITF